MDEIIVTNRIQKQLAIKFLALSEVERNEIRGSLSEENIRIMNKIIDDFSGLEIPDCYLS
jgi:hypothetical protein